MTTLQPWFERRFTFDMPLSRYPKVIERLRGGPARVEDRVRLLPAAADLTNRATHEANHNGTPILGLLERFRTLRFRFVAVLERADASALERTARHPRLGTPLRLIYLAFFTAEHDDHHLARISELLRREQPEH